MPFFWPALIAAALGLLKVFAESAASAAGAAVIQFFVSRVGEQRKETIVAASRPNADRQLQISGSQELLSLLKDDSAYREARSILETKAPKTLAFSEQVEKDLEQAPELVQEFVSGSRPIWDLSNPLYGWNRMAPVSAAQARFLQSDPFKKTCPVGGEEFRFYWEDVTYEWKSPAFAGAFVNEVKLPTWRLDGAPEHYFAVCKNGHRWRVFA